MAKTRFFRVAVEGATVDGRTIDRKWLEEMASTYNRQTYAARVNMEHIRGITADPPFQALGDVLSLKTEEVDIDVGGKTERRLALFAEIDALDPLVAMNRKGQKLYTSIEINPSFAGTGKAYLMGLAVTDSPASLGTEMLEFCAKLGDKSPLASRKQQPGNHFSVASETTIEFAEDPAQDPGGVIASLKGLLERFTGQPPAQAAAPSAPASTEPTPPALGSAAQPAANDFAAIGVALGSLVGTIEKLATVTASSADAQAKRIDALEQRLASTAAGNHTARPIATGVNGNTALTDC